MSANDNGGLAFPAYFHPDSFEGKGLGGMSLRDWFAGQALTGLAISGYSTGDRVRMAYELADAMLKERSK